ncbi:MAG: signal peptidase I [Defluviitaleaceae bacterium]|nr:signal peptidase I [Defluviitaleaceae bacterium]
MNTHIPKQNIIISIIVCVSLLLLYVAFLTIPAASLAQFNMVVRPLVFAILAALVFAFNGKDMRMARGVYTINLMAVLAVVILGVAMLAFAFLFGVILNPMAPNAGVILNNLWNNGTVVLLGAYIQYKLVKKSSDEKQTVLITILTITFALTYMGGLRAAIGIGLTMEFFFVSIFRPLLISASASYFAIKGGYLSVVLVNFAYSMILYLLPFVPDITAIAIALLVSGALLAANIISHFIASEKSPAARIRQRRIARYTKKPIGGYVSFGAILLVLVAFFSGMFPIYPLVVLTSSMEPAISRGSLAFIQRVDADEVYERVGEGYIIHFESGGVPYIHRVVGHWYNHHNVRHYITQGDAGAGPDPYPIPPGDVMGIARATLPFFGFPYIFFRSLTGGFN